METKLNKKSTQNISVGLQMLSDNKMESLSALAEISIILGSPKVTGYFQVSEDVNQFLSSIHILIKDLNKESHILVQQYIDKNGIDKVDNKTKYREKRERVLTLKRNHIKKANKLRSEY